ncbi:hypothetical protein PIB30_110694, partial [Stylosanthes scabra]|nr:hypothetical protein [Stylosanthes scabra]
WRLRQNLRNEHSSAFLYCRDATNRMKRDDGGRTVLLSTPLVMEAMVKIVGKELKGR